MAIDLDDLITQKEAAGIRACTPQTISSLVKRGKLTRYVIGGKVFVSRKEVKGYVPSKGGRPKKIQTSKVTKTRTIRKKRAGRPRKLN